MLMLRRQPKSENLDHVTTEASEEIVASNNTLVVEESCNSERTVTIERNIGEGHDRRLKHRLILC